MASNPCNHSDSDEAYSDDNRTEDNRYHRQHGDFYQNQNDEEERYPIDYTNRVHSIHRNRIYHSPNEVLQCHEARIGGTYARTMSRRKQEGIV